MGGRLSDGTEVNCSRIRKEWVCDPWSNCTESGRAQKALLEEKLGRNQEFVQVRLTCSVPLLEEAAKVGKLLQGQVHHSSQTQLRTIGYQAKSRRRADSPTAIPNIHRRIFATDTESTFNASISLHIGLGEESLCTETLVVEEYEELEGAKWKAKD